MTDLIIQSSNGDVEGSYLGARLASHKAATLNERWQISKKFIEHFGLDEPIRVTEIDDWAIAAGYYKNPEACVGKAGSPANAWRIQQRQQLKAQLNLGGKSSAFPKHEQFKIVVIRTGEIWQAKPYLLKQASDEALSLTKTLKRATARYRKVVERTITAFGVHNMGPVENDIAENIIGAVRMVEEMIQPPCREIDRRMNKLNGRMSTAVESGLATDLPLLEHNQPRAAKPPTAGQE